MAAMFLSSRSSKELCSHVFEGRERETRERHTRGDPLSISGDLPLAFVLAPQNLPEFIVAPQRPNKRCSYCFQTKKVKEGKIRTVKPYY